MQDFYCLKTSMITARTLENFAEWRQKKAMEGFAEKYLVASLASVLILQATLRAAAAYQTEAPAPEQTVISENEQRIHELEDKVSALDAQINAK